MGTLFSNNYNYNININTHQTSLQSLNKPFINSRVIINNPYISVGTYLFNNNNSISILEGISINSNKPERLIKYVFKKDLLVYYFDNHIILEIYKLVNEIKIRFKDPSNNLDIWQIYKLTDNLYQNKINDNSSELDIIHTLIYN